MSKVQACVRRSASPVRATTSRWTRCRQALAGRRPGADPVVAPEERRDPAGARRGVPVAVQRDTRSAPHLLRRARRGSRRRGPSPAPRVSTASTPVAASRPSTRRATSSATSASVQPVGAHARVACRRAPGRGRRPCRPGSSPAPATSACWRSAHGSPPPTARASGVHRAQRGRAAQAVRLEAEAALELAQRRLGRGAEDAVDRAGEEPEDDQPLLQRGDVVPAHQVPGREQQDPVAEPPAGAVEDPRPSAARRRRRRPGPGAAGRPGRPPRGATSKTSGRGGVGRVAAGRRRRADRGRSQRRATHAWPTVPAAQGAPRPRRPWPGVRQERHAAGQPSQSASSRSRMGFGLAPMIVLTSSPPW